MISPDPETRHGWAWHHSFRVFGVYLFWKWELPHRAHEMAMEALAMEANTPWPE